MYKVAPDGGSQRLPRDPLTQRVASSSCSVTDISTTQVSSGETRSQSISLISRIEGHLHDGGVAIDMFVNGKYACSSDAVYGGDGGTTTTQNGKKWETISAMTLCSGPFKVRDGDYVTLNARYDLTKHPL